MKNIVSMLREQVRTISLSLSLSLYRNPWLGKTAHNTNALLRKRGDDEVIRDGRGGWQKLVKVGPWKASDDQARRPYDPRENRCILLSRGSAPPFGP